MSRSRKYPKVGEYTYDKSKLHRRVRKFVRAELSKPEVDEVKIETTAKDLDDACGASWMDMSFVENEKHPEAEDLAWLAKAKRK